MDIAAVGFSRGNFIIQSKLFPVILIVWNVPKNMGHNRFGSMTEVFQQTTNFPFVVEAISNKPSGAAFGVGYGLGVATKCAFTSHGRLPEARVRKGKAPDFIDFSVFDLGNNIEFLKNGAVIHIIGLVKILSLPPALHPAQYIQSRWKGCLGGSPG